MKDCSKNIARVVQNQEHADRMPRVRVFRLFAITQRLQYNEVVRQDNRDLRSPSRIQWDGLNRNLLKGDGQSGPESSADRTRTKYFLSSTKRDSSEY